MEILQFTYKSKIKLSKVKYVAIFCDEHLGLLTIFLFIEVLK